MEEKKKITADIICSVSVERRIAIICNYFCFPFLQVHELTIIPVGQNL